MNTLSNKTIIVAGGTGNIGGFVVQALLHRGATVVVPSRSADKIEELTAFLSREGGDEHRGDLETFIGDVGLEETAGPLRKKIIRRVGPPDAVVASLGRFVPAPSLLDATVDDLNEALRGYLLSHFVVAGTFLPTLAERGGTYVFINGPLAFKPWKNSGAGLVSIATAGQQMLFRAFAQELEESPAHVVEYVVEAFVRNRQTQPSSPATADEVGSSVAEIIARQASEARSKTR